MKTQAGTYANVLRLYISGIVLTKKLAQQIGKKRSFVNPVLDLSTVFVYVRLCK